jgi:3-methyladenine DNA glycosylase AlkC
MIIPSEVELANRIGTFAANLSLLPSGYAARSFQEHGRLAQVENARVVAPVRRRSEPMREALARLAAEGFVEQRAQRGMRLPELNFAEPQDMSTTRQIAIHSKFNAKAVK